MLLALILASCAVSAVAQTGAPATPVDGEDARASWTFDDNHAGKVLRLTAVARRRTT
jgi:hypothetical protein